MCDVFCVLVTFLYDVLGQVWYLIVLIADLCLLLYFLEKSHLVLPRVVIV